MSVNSSSSSSSPSSSNASVPDPENFFNGIQRCIHSTAGSFTFISFSITNLLFLLPLYALVLLLGFQRWRLQRSGAMSHTDLITFYMVVMELVAVCGSVLILVGRVSGRAEMLLGGIYVYFSNVAGQTNFHVLTCLERYMAVVHPIAYRGLRTARHPALRNLAVSCVWLLSFVMTLFIFGQNSQNSNYTMVFFTLSSVTALAVILFCSVSVLCALLRPGPGDGGEAGGRQRPLDQAKLRAFYTILAVLGAMVLRFGADVVTAGIFITRPLTATVTCVLWLSTFWVSVPSSLVLPLIFLMRAGIFQCCSDSGPGAG